jgi:hypothetical protein
MGSETLLFFGFEALYLYLPLINIKVIVKYMDSMEVYLYAYVN